MIEMAGRFPPKNHTGWTDDGVVTWVLATVYLAGCSGVAVGARFRFAYPAAAVALQSSLGTVLVKQDEAHCATVTEIQRFMRKW